MIFVLFAGVIFVFCVVILVSDYFRTRKQNQLYEKLIEDYGSYFNVARKKNESIKEYRHRIIDNINSLNLPPSERPVGLTDKQWQEYLDRNG